MRSRSGTPPKIPLGEHAFLLMAQDDRAFRQALILATDSALAQFSLPDMARERLDATLHLLDLATRCLCRHEATDEELSAACADTKARRALLFAPEEAAEAFGLSARATTELLALAEMANALAEALFGAGSRS